MPAAAIDTTRMSTRGQVIIPKEIRDYVDVGEGTIFTVMPLDKQTIIMRKMDKGKIRAELQAMRARTGKISLKEVTDEVRAARQSKSGA
ncbi:AbrB/MazE/SpoVT family DNA-binding domain-containing protein [Candidatus Woesearchaeota archaeon]|nr:AbrB/MazE/SpoVT family DNA-binding domain-containing protein [Candidatus Woesearchaeota archaeon]